jgi:hypothetical protein
LPPSATFKYGAPVLLGPPAGREINNAAGIVPILTWEPVAELAANEYYHVTLRVRRQNGEVVRWIGLDTAGAELTITEGDAILMRTSPQMSEVSWWVVVLSQKDSPWQPGKDGVAISPDSETRIFLMQP